MSKNDVLAKLQNALSNPGSLKSGEYLKERIAEQLRRVIRDDREGVVQALGVWLELREEPETMLAVHMAGQFDIKELREGIEQLSQDVENGRAFLPYYKRWINDALDALKF